MITPTKEGRRRRRKLPSQERLRELFLYDPITGALTRRIATSNSVKVGDIVGCLNRGGHWVGHVDGQVFVLHLVIWKWMTGKDPSPEIDHKNTIGSDNRWTNLREATRSQNAANIRTPSKNTSGVKGVNPAGTKGKWIAKIAKDGKQYYLGTFDSKEEAAAAYFAKSLEFNGEFARAA